MATKTKGDTKPADPRGQIVDALLSLAGERRFEDIAIRDICEKASVSLADFRDAFPSKGAVLAGFSRRIDREVLSEETADLSDEFRARTPVRYPYEAARNHGALPRRRTRNLRLPEA